MANNPNATDNLVPFTGANDPRRGHPKKGSKHISTWIQDMLNDEEFDTLISHPTKGFIEFKGAPLKAIIQVAMRKALAGDDRAMEWLAKHGYGTKQIIELSDPRKEILEQYMGGGGARQTKETTDGSSQDPT